MARRPRAPARHAAALVFGLRAEAVAALWLGLKGYRILERRYAVGGGELDLIAARGEVVAFVEVKARRLLDDAMTAVTARKRGRMHRAVRHWLARNPWAVHRVLRGDAVFVAPRRLPKHLVNAFDLDVH